MDCFSKFKTTYGAIRLRRMTSLDSFVGKERIKQRSITHQMLNLPLHKQKTLDNFYKHLEELPTKELCAIYKRVSSNEAKIRILFVVEKRSAKC